MDPREPVVVRPARTRDLDDLIAVQRAAGRAAGDRFRAATGESIEDPARCVVVATAGPDVVGWATTWHFPEPDGPAPAGQYLMGIAVHPDHRRAGVARALTAARLAWIRETADAVHCVTNARNAASIALHAEFGFREVARAASFRGIAFDGGEGILLTARLA